MIPWYAILLLANFWAGDKLLIRMSTTKKESRSFGGSRLAFGRAVGMYHHKWSVGMLSCYWLTFELETSFRNGCKRVWRSFIYLVDLVWPLAGPSENIITNDSLVCYLIIGWLLCWRSAFEMCTNEWLGVPLVCWISFGLWQGHPNISSQMIPWYAILLLANFSAGDKLLIWMSTTKKESHSFGGSRSAIGRDIRIYHHIWSLGMLFYCWLTFELETSFW